MIYGPIRLASSIAVGTLTLLLAAVQSHAQALPDTRAMTCAQAQAFVVQSGAVVMATGRYTYDRFVSSQAYCTPELNLKAFYAPTADVYECPVAYRCADIFHGNGDRDTD
ncbi:hypothetical protein HPQ64_17555 [Rhizobiales bacterium]|uniref:hypothetical protein n=1 Tax=Hongsoonwoonella zoysiae TaxID=2821844 RepID=UPI001561A6DB|nr:hypothetical protein [Hongsoonwoonella zoysiae]NRG19501.1 hypothetical protein [Hongsoonwoonella zoysiae]